MTLADEIRAVRKAYPMLQDSVIFLEIRRRYPSMSDEAIWKGITDSRAVAPPSTASKVLSTAENLIWATMAGKTAPAQAPPVVRASSSSSTMGMIAIAAVVAIYLLRRK